MQTYLFESVADPFTLDNWGAFLVAVPDEIEWGWRSRALPAGAPLPEMFGWNSRQAWVMDLRTGEGAIFTMGGDARADLDAHRIHVTAQFEAFLEWLYGQDLARLRHLPYMVKVADHSFSIRNHRRLGPFPVSFTLRKGDLIQIEWAGEAQAVICDGITGDGAVIRSLTEDETRQLAAGAEEPGPAAGDEPHEPDYEEMREGLPPPVTGDGDGDGPGIPAAVITAAGSADETIVIPAVDGEAPTAVIPAADALTEVLPAVTGRKGRR